MQADYDVLLPHNIECWLDDTSDPIAQLAVVSEILCCVAALLHDSALTAASLQCHRVLWKVFVAVHAW